MSVRRNHLGIRKGAFLHLLRCASRFGSYALRRSTQCAVEARIERLSNCISISALLQTKESTPDKFVYFSFSQVDTKALKPVFPTLAITTHALSGG
jgi:hypothetical protein